MDGPTGVKVYDVLGSTNKRQKKGRLYEEKKKKILTWISFTLFSVASNHL